MIYLFNSIDFILFFILIFLAYWILPNHFKNIFLLIVSYVFYASWNWKLLSLLLISSIANYFCGLWVLRAKNQASKRFYLILGILFNLSLLGFFKYFNFFAENFFNLLNAIGFKVSFTALKIILPLGISFYTFRALSYIIDVYTNKFAPTRNFIDFSLFIAYFPHLIAGPIERAKDIVPQLQAEKQFRNINYKEGFYLFIYGLFKKVVIADTVASVVNGIFAFSSPSGAQVLLAIYAFAVQIYCDFSGYTDMARGISYFLGIKSSINFNLPFFTKKPSDFLKRWHITLSKWITDYVYMPLFFHLSGKSLMFLKNIRVKFYISGIIATFATMVAFGFWHGASWNFIFMGVYLFAIVMASKVFEYLSKRFVPAIKNKFIQYITSALSIVLTSHIIWYGLTFSYKSQSTIQVYTFTKSLISNFKLSELFVLNYWYLYLFIAFLVIYEVLQYMKNDELFITKQNFYIQLVFYLIIALVYINVGAITNVEFVYFQF
ncbi:MBOAT family protein [Candidatus Woesearchaeota archaeon]|nr:MBOAT family protein [Candidatus Woesearchaeota archaeon]